MQVVNAFHRLQDFDHGNFYSINKFGLEVQQCTSDETILARKRTYPRSIFISTVCSRN